MSALFLFSTESRYSHDVREERGRRLSAMRYVVKVFKLSLDSNFVARYPNSIEMKLTRTVGESLPLAVRGETNMLQHLFADNLLNTYYTDAMGLKESTEFLAKTVSQIVHRYSHMEILEIGNTSIIYVQCLLMMNRRWYWRSYQICTASYGFGLFFLHFY